MRQSDIDLVNMPTPNMDLLDRVIDKIEADIDAWNQDSWGDIKGSAWQEEEPCGTTACFAGHAVIEAGVARLVIERSENGFWDTRFVTPSGDNLSDIEGTAAEALGLPYADAYEIFYHFPVDADYDEDTATIRGTKEADLQWFKTKVEELRGRYIEQERAFNRIAEELIASVPELEDVLKPGYACPESREALREALKKFRGRS